MYRSNTYGWWGVYSKIYYAPYVGEVAIDNEDGVRIVDLANIQILSNFDEMNAIYHMHINGDYYSYDYDEYNFDSYEDTNSSQDEFEYEDINRPAIDGDLEAVKSLIENGLDINNQNEFGITMLMEASRNGHIDIVDYLLKNGADPNIKAVNTETALFWAVDDEYTDIVKMLLDAGAETNLKGEFDRTPLLAACRLGNVEIARLLLEYGADPNLKLDTIDGSMPLSVAKEKGITELVRMLENYMNTR